MVPGLMSKSELNDFSPYALTCRRPLKAGRADLVRSALVQRPCLRERQQDETIEGRINVAQFRGKCRYCRFGHAPFDIQSLHSGPRHILPAYCGLLRARGSWPKNVAAAPPTSVMKSRRRMPRKLVFCNRQSLAHYEWPARNKGHPRPFADATLARLATRTEPGANRLPLRVDRKLEKAFYVYKPQY